MGWVGWVVHSLHGVTRHASKLRWAGLRVTHTLCHRHIHGERDDAFRLRWAGHIRKRCLQTFCGLSRQVARACFLKEYGCPFSMHIWGSRARSLGAGKTRSATCSPKLQPIFLRYCPEGSCFYDDKRKVFALFFFIPCSFVVAVRVTLYTSSKEGRVARPTHVE